MKITNSLNPLALLTLVVSMTVGCATTPKETEEVAEAPPAVEPAPQQKAATSTGSYTVVAGDNLWNIAGKSSIYGNPYQWPLIYKANKSKITDADLIYPRQVFDIVQSPSASEVKAAVNHAKTRGAWSIGSVEASDTSYLAR